MSMRFCRECNNLLYPKENRELKKLEYACRLCPYIDKQISSSCVYTNELIKDSSTRLDVIQKDLNQDPTLQRSHNICCPGCSFETAVFFQAEQTAKSTALNLVYICCRCGYKWMD
mmetsp:Transcript_22249/g.22425  ORF Transcript_22249/g.22425 Transcript_22249/m.22425 type:complete len:115 (-) Transcript_22249:24-368(-)